MKGSLARASGTLALIPEVPLDYEGVTARTQVEKALSPEGESPGSARVSRLLLDAGFRHAFFTRQGGVSAGEFESLNFSVSVGDAPGNVAENLARAAGVLGVAPERLFFASQVHGNTALLVDEDDGPNEVVHWECDALVGTAPGSAIGVRTADCVPILVGDRLTGAVVAIHAGWRGLVGGVVRAGLEALRRVAGDTIDPVAAIGPHITTPRFEVSEDVAAKLAASAPGRAVVERTFGPRPHVSLSGVARSALAEFGLGDAAIDEVPGCTAGDRELFFSYRRDGARSGRHLSAIVPRARITGTRA